ncbi:MAG: sugar O-acetyltransferase [Christensenellales bacterium]|jgi:maltose O-acetyltransferase
MNMKERMTGGLLYIVNDELRPEVQKSRKLVRMFNSTTEDETEYRAQLIKELFSSTGQDVYIEPPFRCDYGMNISVGNNFYANFNCVILDVCPVIIGDNVMFGPDVGIYTASHPIDAAIRATKVEYGKPITIGDNVWIGGHTVINGGVNIGEGTIIGSGSVVTKSIPSGVIAAGNPCSIIRSITKDDSEYWQRQKTEFDNALSYER